MSNNSVNFDYGSMYQSAKNNPASNAGKPALTKKPRPKETSGGGSGGSSGGYSGGGSSGGGGGVSEGPTQQEARAIVMAGMKDYLGREASKKEVKAFFKKFTAFSAGNDNSVSAGVQDEFLQDWIEDRPKLRKEQAQYKTATTYMNALDRAISQARSL